MSAAEAYAWHGRPGAFERLMPPWQQVRVLERSGGIERGRVVIEVRAGPLRHLWTAEHTPADPGREFLDAQVSGPFRKWEHRHRFEPDAPGAYGEPRCVLEDRIEYELPFGWPWRALGERYVCRKLARLFAYRHAVTGGDLCDHAEWRGRSRRRVLITGSSGLIGRALTAYLSTGGHEVACLVRGALGRAGAGSIALTEIPWDPVGGRVDVQALSEFSPDVVVHLAGESVATGRWRREKKRRILESRVRGTNTLARAIAMLPRPPESLLAASAVGCYGDRGDEILTERSGPGSGFLAGVCREWEDATRPAAEAGVRTVKLRFGVVLSGAGGALASAARAFRFGLGARLGNGRQWMPCVSLDDALGAIGRCMMDARAEGPVNVVGPRPVTNEEFTATLARVLRRPALFAAPAPLLRGVFGEIADEALLTSLRVEPRVLHALGHRFRHPTLEQMLRHELGRRDPA